MLKILKKIKDDIFSLLSESKVYLLFFAIPFTLGIILGIIYLVNFKEVLTIKNLIDFRLYRYLTNEISLFVFFLRNFFLLVLFNIFIFIFHLNRYTQFLCFVLILYLSYYLCFNTGIVILCFGFFGIIYSLVYYLIFGLCFIILLSIMIVFCRQCLLSGNYINSCKNGYPLIVFLMCASLVLCLVQLVLLPFMTSTFIIVL